MAQLATAVQGLAVVAAVEEKFGLADHTVRTTQFGQQIIDMHDLIHRVRRSGLLAVAKSSIGDMNIPRARRLRIELDGLAVDVFNQRTVEQDLRRQSVVEHFFQQIGLRGIDQRKGVAICGHVFLLVSPGWWLPRSQVRTDEGPAQNKTTPSELPYHDPGRQTAAGRPVRSAAGAFLPPDTARVSPRGRKAH